MHGLAGIDCTVLAPRAFCASAVEIFVALASGRCAEFALKYRVEVLDVVFWIDDINTVRQGVEDAQQAGAVGGQRLGQRLCRFDLADVGVGQDDAISLAALATEGQHAFENPAAGGAFRLAFDALTGVGNALEVSQKTRNITETVGDIGHRTSLVLRLQCKKFADRRTEAANPQFGIEKYRADLGAGQQVIVVAIEVGECRIFLFQFAVEGVEIFIDRFQFFIGALQFFVRRRQFLVRKVDAFVAALQFNDAFVQPVACGQQFGFENFRVVTRFGGQFAQRQGVDRQDRCGDAVGAARQAGGLLAVKFARAVDGHESARLVFTGSFAAAEQ